MKTSDIQATTTPETQSKDLLKPRKRSLKRKLLWGSGIVVGCIVAFYGMLQFSVNQLLSPSWRGATKDLSVCKPETVKYWGKDCGNLRKTHGFAFSEVKIRSMNGYDLPGWLVKAADNGREPSTGAIMLVHAGGSDRREMTRYITFYLSQKLDVLTFDMGCQGEAPCPVRGMTYGERESSDILSAYTYLAQKYTKVYAMGTSVGAAAILVALPEMPNITGVIAENSYASFQRLIKEAPQSKSMPAWAVNNLINTTLKRGKFSGLLSPEHSLALAHNTPILFIHSKKDTNTSYRQTEDLANFYQGPKTVWLPEKGDHAAIWDVDRTAYEQKISEFLSNK